MYMNHVQSPASTLIERSPRARAFMLTLCFGLLTALGAQVAVRLPFTPVPVTLQVFFVILSGLMLGSRLAALSQVQYVLMGLMGMPVFAGFTSGPVALMGPSGGYIIGFVAAAFAVGFVRERLERSRFAGVLAVSAGIIAIYLFGVAHLAILFCGGNVSRAIVLGAVPFIGVDAAKAIFALGLSGIVDRASRGHA